ncbi:hypothetical protein JH06_1408 [Blastocystis sp. subtype 4]|uniref:hypothetical protein n=1 Tax=Blastocystis sp. subtype 4 TaxID=944170 RepID=UPI000711F4A3|nr:hypothetical protein JH06_1408 [Blastocystis sp. subtype 4]KNB46760.1 hypothetical protein JH06_1408 [Blastocystis sp. subtype 4]|eukprot:XP_014530222.1 hypothetical protein JH06_1408 [Blastocystis sp. subtype 4]
MLSFAIRHTASIGKTQIVAPVRTIVTCANHNVFTPQRTNYTPLVYQQKRTFLGPMMRYVTQFLASLGGTSIRAFFQAFQQAAEFSLKKGISIPESLQILNMTREEVNPTSLSERFDKYFEANDPKSGGSFYLQSKVYRAHEALLDELDKYGYIRDESAKVKPPVAEPASNVSAEEKK